MAEKTLKMALLSNALFSTLSGLTFIMFSQPVADLIGIGATLVYQVIGVGLLGFAGYVTWAATRNPLDAFTALQISIGDFLWVISTILVIGMAYTSLTSTGILVMLFVAAIVLLFGLFQLKGIEKMYAVPGKAATHRICVAINTPEPAEKMWSIVADLPKIKAYSPHLIAVILRDGAEPGVNAVRQCTDDKGKTWAEHCTRYDHVARAFDVQFLADEPGFPYPFQSMNGGWEVVPNYSGSTVNLWFEVTPKYGMFQPLILALMTKDLASNFADVVARMAAAARGETVSSAAASARGISYRLLPSC